MTAGSESIEQANMFHLTGHGVTVSLALTGIDGRPTLAYQDFHHALSFTGDDITIEDSVLGQLVSVTLVQTEDVGYTSFSVLIPTMNIVGGYNRVETLGVTAVHRSGLIGPGPGQATAYHAIRLHGTASQIQP